MKRLFHHLKGKPAAKALDLESAPLVNIQDHMAVFLEECLRESRELTHKLKTKIGNNNDVLDPTALTLSLTVFDQLADKFVRQCLALTVASMNTKESKREEFFKNQAVLMDAHVFTQYPPQLIYLYLKKLFFERQQEGAEDLSLEVIEKMKIAVQQQLDSLSFPALLTVIYIATRKMIEETSRKEVLFREDNIADFVTVGFIKLKSNRCCRELASTLLTCCQKPEMTVELAHLSWPISFDINRCDGANQDYIRTNFERLIRHISLTVFGAMAVYLRGFEQLAHVLLLRYWLVLDSEKFEDAEGCALTAFTSLIGLRMICPEIWDLVNNPAPIKPLLRRKNSVAAFIHSNIRRSVSDTSIFSPAQVSVSPEELPVLKLIYHLILKYSSGSEYVIESGSFNGTIEQAEFLNKLMREHLALGFSKITDLIASKKDRFNLQSIAEPNLLWTLSETTVAKSHRSK